MHVFIPKKSLSISLFFYIHKKTKCSQEIAQQFIHFEILYAKQKTNNENIVLNRYTNLTKIIKKFFFVESHPI